ncbi:MAG: glutamine--fructose-6-phosphate transaminase (isomerizing) [Nitrososphaera sp.]|uniref:Glutamine--fructose-6-phosphate aminotransferase [isomerizing] n=1 Tax=Nitrososphaera gargensis (strain Ga9.2) TaxID=1237085 RepID=K0INQ3_NITGG|nr:glutamine--fructose-6-phosphate transaminase (isomerizing) [Candidatus Nitrososphaera gargensis]AFU59774.1 glucosamine-fructose-6-phosphate aminotransferase [Candidatus Nitrososphaera gargensis Ga9.2]
MCCSIIGIISSKNVVAPALVDSLKRMEYRGYDSVGVATLATTNRISVRKGIGKVNQVNSSLNLTEMEGFVGIGHSRWATHGGVTDYNAHPHPCCTEDIAVVHNGIIENYLPLKEELVKKGHRFRSETDTEVIAHLLEDHYNASRDIKAAMLETVSQLEGSYAFVAMFANGSLACARLDEPLVIGVSDNAYYASSDVLGFLQYTDQAMFLDNRDIAIIDRDGAHIFTFAGEPVTRGVTKVAWELADVNKGEFAHYTIKEIFEQRTSVKAATYQEEHKIKVFCDTIAAAGNIIVTGSGTSYHTSLITSMAGCRALKKRFEPVMASEFKYNMDSIDKDTVVLAISQSGETADVLSATKLARAAGAKILSIVNVSTSSLARAADVSLAINSGPEIGVAATKSFTGQVSLAYSVLDRISGGRIGFDRDAVSDKITKMLAGSAAIERLVNVTMPKVNDIYLLGRSIHFPIALEGALKMKELAYVHAEGIAAGELKHGPLALMDKNAVVFVLNPDDKTYGDTLSSAHEVKTRGAKIIGISNVSNDIYDAMIEIPKMENELLYPLVEVIPLQLFSYYLALRNNVDPDFPRNLAKSVTVK